MLTDNLSHMAPGCLLYVCCMVCSTPPPADPEERLEVVLKSMPDVDTLMATMPRAIRAAVAVSMP
jgi:hypothetical protein